MKVRVESLESSNQSLAAEVKSLVSAAKLQEIETKAYEVVRLYHFYHVEDAIGATWPELKSWMKFTEKWSDLELNAMKQLGLQRESGIRPSSIAAVQQHPIVLQLLQLVQESPLKDTQFQFSLYELRDICRDRHPGRRIRSPYTLVNDRIRTPYTWTVNDRFFPPYITVFLRIRSFTIVLV